MTKDYCFTKVAVLTVTNTSKNTAPGMAVVFVSSHHDGSGKRRTTMDVYPDVDKAKAAAAAMRAAGGTSAPVDHHASRSAHGRSHILTGLSDAQMRRVYLDFMKEVDEDEADDADPLIGHVIKAASLTVISEAGELSNVITDVTVCLAEMEHSRTGCYDITFDVGQGRQRSTRSKQAVRDMQDEADSREDGGPGEDTAATAKDAAVQAAGAPMLFELARRLERSAALMSAPGIKELSAVDCVQLARLAGLTVATAAADTESAHQAAGAGAMIAIEVALSAAEARYASREAARPGSGGTRPEAATHSSMAGRARLARQLREFFSGATSDGGRGKAPARLTPRLDALRARLGDPNEWEEVCETVVGFAVDPKRITAVMAYEDTRHGAVERYLEKFKARAAPVMLAAVGMDGDLSAGECVGLVMQIEAEHTAEIEQATADKAGRPGRSTTHTFVASNITGTESERREVSQLVSAAAKVESSADASMRLAAMAARAQQGDTAGMIDLVERERTEAEPDLLQLIQGDEVAKALEGRVEADTLLQLQGVRDALDTRNEAAVYGAHVQPTTKQKAALRWTRMGRLDKVRLGHLLDLPDKGTEDDPLLSIAKLGDKALGVFAQGMGKLAQALSVANPSGGPEVLAFTSRMVEFVTADVNRGVQWSTISKLLYRPVMQRASKTANAFAVDRCAARHTPLDTEWIDGSSTYRRKYDGEAMAEQAQEAARKAGPSPKGRGGQKGTPKQPKGKARQPAGGGLPKSKSAKRRAAKAKAKAGGAKKQRVAEVKTEDESESGSDSDSDGSSEDDSPKAGKSTAAELLAAHGMQGKKKPCRFFFNFGKCKFGDECFSHHIKG